MIHCRSVSSPARQSTSTISLMVTSRKGRLLITTTPRRFPHHCQALGLVITNTTWSVFSFQNVSTIVRSCYTSHHDTSSLSGQVSKAEVVVIGKYNKEKEKNVNKMLSIYFSVLRNKSLNNRNCPRIVMKASSFDKIKFILDCRL